MSSQQSEWFISKKKKLYLKRKPCLKDTDFNKLSPVAGVFLSAKIQIALECQILIHKPPNGWRLTRKKARKWGTREGNWMLSSLLTTSKLDNLKFFIVFICMCNVHMNAHMWRKENNFFDACLFPQASGRSSSGHQSQCQVPLPSEPSHRPLMSHSVMQDQQ